MQQHTKITYKDRDVFIPQYVESELGDNYEFNHERVVNAADFGVPQERKRLYFIGFRKDINCENYELPEDSIDFNDETYIAWAKDEKISLKESKDLKNWFNANKVLVVEEDSTWIKMHVGKPTVIKINGEFKMYFEAPATLKDGGGKEFDNNVLLATSKDGKKWSYWTNGGNEPYPVLAMSKEEMDASYNFSNENPSGYGYYGLGQPSVCYVNGKYYLFFYVPGVGGALYNMSFTFKYE